MDIFIYYKGIAMACLNSDTFDKWAIVELVPLLDTFLKFCYRSADRCPQPCNPFTLPVFLPVTVSASALCPA